MLCLDKEEHSGPNHAEKLGTFVDEALSFIDDNNLHLDAVAVSGGPGSYTGLRIGVSMAKGICYGRNTKLLAIPTLELLAVPVLLHHEEIEENALIVPMIDARRMEVYAQVFDRSLKTIRPIHADIVDENTYQEYLDKGPVYFFGNGAEKCMKVINHPNAHLITGIEALQRTCYHWLRRESQRKSLRMSHIMYLSTSKTLLPRRLNHYSESYN